MKMQLLYGVFPIIRGKGSAAKSVADMLDEMTHELGPEAVETESKFDELILIDREGLKSRLPPRVRVRINSATAGRCPSVSGRGSNDRASRSGR